MARPVIALLTDFGLQDHYVGVMKGVMLGICPDAQLVDITHEIPPQQIRRGMLALDAAYRFFPQGTVFLCVVDPAVGSSRRAVALSAGGYHFVAPDNGLLSRVASNSPGYAAVELVSRAHQLPVVSRTFEGRDRLAPAAGWLASSLALDALGPRLSGLTLLNWPVAQTTGSETRGEVVASDRFGNLVTNINRTTLPPGRVLEVTIGGHVISGVVSAYVDVGIGELCALLGSSDDLEIAVRDGSAVDRTRVDIGVAVQVRALA